MNWIRKQLNTLYSRTFMGMLVISLSVLTAVAAMFFIYLRREMLDGYHQLTYTTLGNVDSSFTQIIADNKMMIAEWSDSADGLCFRIKKNENPVEHMSFVKRIQERLLRGTYLHSVYFVDQEEVVSLFIGSNLSTTENLDELLVAKLQELDQRNQPFVWSVKMRYKSDRMVPLLSIPISDSLPGEDDFNGMVVLNLSLEILRNTLLAERNAEDFQIIILDAKGNIVCHSDKEYIGENWSEKEWVQRITGNEFQFEAEENGTKWEFCAIQSGVQEFYLVAQSEYGTQHLNINYIIYMTLVISIIAGGVIGFMMLLVSKRIFAPFTNMIGTLKSSQVGSEISKEMDEIAFLEYYYQGISSKLDLLNDKKEKDVIIKNLMLGNQKKEIAHMMMQKGIIAESKPYYMFLVAIQNTNKQETYNMQEYDMSRNLVSGLFLSALEKYGHATYFEVGLRRMLFVISGEHIVDLKDYDMLEMVQHLEISIQKISQIQIYGVLSGKLFMEECVSCFKKLSEHLKTRQLLEKKEFIILTDVFEEGETEYAEKLTEYLKDRNKGMYMETVEAMLNVYGRLSYDDFAEKMEKIIVEVMKVGKIHKSSSSIDEGWKNVRERINTITTQEELLLWLESIYDAAAIQINRNSGNVTAALMEKAVDYIRNHYDDSNLNVNTLSERVGISAAYFGKLFTEFTGMRTLDYILQIRMEKAHDLLLAELDKDISHIAEKVGYSNSTYFTTAFKKYYGITPSKFRAYYLTTENKEEGSE